ncbi:hypothetical protein Taro_041317 [Colocasia esculenta]|uniref:tRNA N(3)-methylcytidine methyltransferase n=1 Tax=Colocasia esculenta TaxID=4460 RepID=A0A843X099_COLES|nr:hypothetical protein [Colocasia esculenta]
MTSAGAAVEYHTKDFEWDELREEVEKDPSLRYHLAPSSPPPGHHQDLLSSSPSRDCDAWRSFHRQHSTGRFFKERRYLLKEFPELAAHDGRPRKVLEVGCGNGSTALPILRAGENILVYACDCSSDALERAKEMIENAGDPSMKERFHPFLLDISVCGFAGELCCNSCRTSPITRSLECSSDVKDKFCEANGSPSVDVQCCISGVDYVTLVFTLSAVPFQKMPFLLSECISILKPGGLLLFRDYGNGLQRLYDMTMLRFPPEQKVGFREYMRSDGTFSYFFSLDVVRNLFLDAGFLELELEYCCIRSVNRLKGKDMHRVWAHGKFRKPV